MMGIRRARFYTKVVFGVAPNSDRLQKCLSGFLYLSNVVTISCYIWSTFQSSLASLKVYSSITCVVAILGETFVPLNLYFGQTFDECWRWCESLQLRFGHSKSFKKCRKFSKLLFEFMIGCCPVASTVMLLLQTIVLSLLKHELVPVVILTFPFQNTYIKLLICTLQLSGLFQLGFAFMVMFTYIFVMLRHFIAILEYSTEMVTVLVDFSNLKQVVDIYCEMVQYYNVLAHFSFVPTLLLELIANGLLLFTWLVVFFMHDLAFAAIVSMGYLLPYIALCWLQEQFVEASRGLANALYDLPWYNMAPKERKVLLQIMVAVGQPKVLRVGPFHVICFEEFGQMLNSVYSYGLFINNLVASG